MTNAVIFDLFETLVDFSVEEYNHMLGQMCEYLSVEKEAFTSSWHESWPEYEVGRFENVHDYIQHVSNGSCDPSGLDAAATLHLQYERDILAPRSGVTGVLEKLRGRGYRIGVVTNCAVETPHFWPQTELAPLVDSAVFSSLEKIRKPDPEIFEVCVERLQLMPSECLFVGDGANDELSAAQLAGITPVLLTNHGTSGETHSKSWKGLVLDDLAGIETILRG